MVGPVRESCYCGWGGGLVMDNVYYSYKKNLLKNSVSSDQQVRILLPATILKRSCRLKILNHPPFGLFLRDFDLKFYKNPTLRLAVTAFET